jgi:uncharacterized protein YrrD
MLLTLKSLLGCRLMATDGDMGTIDDVYFDHVLWTVRFVVLKTGSWLSFRDVFIPPGALSKYGWGKDTLLLSLTKDQIRASPDAAGHWPVFRQNENELFQYHFWKNYWESVFSANGVWGSVVPVPSMDGQREAETQDREKQAGADLHLRSIRQVLGYTIRATDGHIGHLKDLVFDDLTWNVFYVEVDTHDWFGGKRILVSVKHVKDVLWESSSVLMDLDMAFINNGSEVVGLS